MKILALPVCLSCLATALLDQTIATPPSSTTSAQVAYIKASNTGNSGKNGVISNGDQFGTAVAISGDTMVIGAPGEDSPSAGINGGQGDGSFEEDNQDSGAAYVFVKNGETWEQQAYLKASNPSADFFGDAFGAGVAIDGNTIAVGAPAEDSLSTINQSNNDGNRAGAVYVFVRNGSNWTQQAYIKPSNPDSRDQFGSHIQIDGDTMVISAFFEDGSSPGINATPNNDAQFSGAVYVYTRDAEIWTQQAYIKASNPNEDDGFGSSISLDGDTLVVGASGEDSASVAAGQSDNSLSGSGAAYVFTRSNGDWSQQAFLKPSKPGLFDGFGSAVSVSGDTLAVGAPREAVDDNLRRNNGIVFVFNRSGSIWTESQLLRSPTVEFSEEFGANLQVEGDALLVGAPLFSGGLNASGAAYLFLRDEGSWSYSETLRASNLGAQDNFGRSIALEGCLALIGAPLEEGGGTGVNPSVSNNSTPGAGAAYLFNLALPLAAPPIAVSSATLSGGQFTISFKAESGLTGWVVKASPTLTSFPLDLTSQATIAEPVPGSYQATINVADQGPKLFIRIERAN